MEWKNGKVTTCERRILFTKWLGEAWGDYATNNQEEITGAFKRVGMYNDIHGKENHLIKLQGLPDYKPPAIDDEPELVVDAPKKRKRKQSKKARKAKKKARKPKKKAKQ